MNHEKTHRNEIIARLYDGGLTYGEIANEIGSTRSTIAGVVHRLKAKRKREVRARHLAARAAAPITVQA